MPISRFDWFHIFASQQRANRLDQHFQRLGFLTKMAFGAVRGGELYSKRIIFSTQKSLAKTDVFSVGGSVVGELFMPSL